MSAACGQDRQPEAGTVAADQADGVTCGSPGTARWESIAPADTVTAVRRPERVGAVDMPGER